MAESFLLYIFDSGRNGVFHLHPIQEAGVDHFPFLCVETLLADVATLDDRDNRKIELLRESVIPAVVGWNSHDGTSAVAGEDIFGDPDWNPFPSQGIHSVRSGEHSRDGFCLSDPLSLRLFLYIFKIISDFRLLPICREKLHKVAFRSQDHECHTEDSVNPRGEYGNVMLLFPAIALEDNLAAPGLTDPVTLHLLERISPVNLVKTVQKPTGVCGDPQLPLHHLLLLDREASSHGQAILHLVIGEHCSKTRAPVDGSLSLICDTVIHQHV